MTVGSHCWKYQLKDFKKYRKIFLQPLRKPKWLFFDIWAKWQESNQGSKLPTKCKSFNFLKNLTLWPILEFLKHLIFLRALRGNVKFHGFHFFENQQKLTNITPPILKKNHHENQKQSWKMIFTSIKITEEPSNVDFPGFVVATKESVSSYVFYNTNKSIKRRSLQHWLSKESKRRFKNPREQWVFFEKCNFEKRYVFILNREANTENSVIPLFGKPKISTNFVHSLLLEYLCSNKHRFMQRCTTSITTMQACMSLIETFQGKQHSSNTPWHEQSTRKYWS